MKAKEWIVSPKDSVLPKDSTPKSEPRKLPAPRGKLVLFQERSQRTVACAGGGLPESVARDPGRDLAILCHLRRG